jgi:hypothetical protein
VAVMTGSLVLLADLIRRQGGHDAGCH